MAFVSIYTYRDFELYYKAHREFLFKVNRFWVITLRAFLLGISVTASTGLSKSSGVGAAPTSPIIEEE